MKKSAESRTTKAVVNAISKYIHHPIIKGGIKLAPKMPNIGANVARVKATWDETCRKQK